MVEGETLDFGVSGLLHEANLLMYDRGTDTLWQQAIGTAVVGELTGAVLDVLPSQFIHLSEVREKYPDATVLSSDTGYERDYTADPYYGYEWLKTTPYGVEFPPEVYHPKKLMYVFRAGDTSVAFALDELAEEVAATEIGGRDVSASRDGDEIFVEVDGKLVPGYIEMWFSWSAQHPEDGALWEIEVDKP